MPAVLHVHRDIHKYAPHNSVYIGRPTKWGNPFKIGVHGNREQVIEQYRQYLAAQPALVEAAKQELRGKDLLCWCAPHACHGDVLLEVANAPD